LPKKGKRSKHASLTKKNNSRIRQEYIDLDYVNELDDTVSNCELPNGDMVTEKEYMSLFMKEWNNAGVGKQEDAKDNVFHRTAKEVKDCTDRNNSRNRCTYSQFKAMGRVIHGENAVLHELNENSKMQASNSTEDALIDIIDGLNESRDSDDDSDND
jgi:hypothetical protein